MCLNIWCTLLCTCICFFGFFWLVIFKILFFPLFSERAWMRWDAGSLHEPGRAFFLFFCLVFRVFGGAKNCGDFFCFVFFQKEKKGSSRPQMQYSARRRLTDFLSFQPKIQTLSCDVCADWLHVTVFFLFRIVSNAPPYFAFFASLQNLTSIPAAEVNKVRSTPPPPIRKSPPSIYSYLFFSFFLFRGPDTKRKRNLAPSSCHFLFVCLVFLQIFGGNWLGEGEWGSKLWRKTRKAKKKKKTNPPPIP